MSLWSTGTGSRYSIDEVPTMMYIHITIASGTKCNMMVLRAYKFMFYYHLQGVVTLEINVSVFGATLCKARGGHRSAQTSGAVYYEQTDIRLDHAL